MTLIPARWRRPAPFAPVQPTSAPEVHRDAPRLTAPQGTVVWVCATATGRMGCAHDSEQAAQAHGQPVWWPVLIDEGYGESA